MIIAQLAAAAVERALSSTGTQVEWRSGLKAERTWPTSVTAPITPVQPSTAMARLEGPKPPGPRPMPPLSMKALMSRYAQKRRCWAEMVSLFSIVMWRIMSAKASAKWGCKITTAQLAVLPGDTIRIGERYF